MLAGVAFAGFTLVLLGLLRLQVVQHEELSRLAEQNRIRLDVLRAPRGAIRDRFGRLLADNQPSFDIVFRPMPAESLSRSRAVIHTDWLMRVASLVQDDTTIVKRRVQEANRTGQTAVLSRNAPYSVMAAVEEMRADIPGVDVQVAPIRRYPEGSLGAQLLGYAGEINDQELEKREDAGYRMGDLIGKTGVERKYEEMLRGQDGAEFVVVNAMGKRVSTLSEGPPRPPIPGHDVTLTIDLDIQRATRRRGQGGWRCLPAIGTCDRGLLFDLFVVAESGHLRGLARHGCLHARKQAADRRATTATATAAGHEEEEGAATFRGCRCRTKSRGQEYRDALGASRNGPAHRLVYNRTSLHALSSRSSSTAAI